MALAVLILSGGAIWHFERHFRVTDSVYVGTWRFPPLLGGDLHVRINADHTFRIFSDEVAEEDTPLRGSWFGGGDFLYFRQPTFDRDGFLTNRPLLIWRVERLSHDELLVHLNPGGIPRTVRRVSPVSP